MRKIKKYVYPVAFVILAFVYLLVSLFIAGVFFSDDWSGLGVLFIAVILLLSIILPIYCVRYSKIIQGEKFRVLFAFYNAFLIVVPCILPFLEYSEAYGYGTVFFVWTLFWSVLFLNSRLDTNENRETLSAEEASVPMLSLQNKTKRILAICFTLPFLITLAANSVVWQFNDIRYVFSFTLRLFAAFLVLVFLFFKNKDYLLKKWLLSLALAGELISELFGICSSLRYINMSLEQNPSYYVNIIYSCLSVALLTVILVGTLFNFKYIKLFKYGALARAVLSFGFLVLGLINVGGTVYHQIDLNGTLAVNPTAVVELLLHALYFMGFFVLGG